MQCYCQPNSDTGTRNDSEQDDQRQKLITEQLRIIEELEMKNRAIIRMLSPDQRAKLESENLRKTGAFENLSDKFSNIKLKERFNKIRRREWLNLYLSITDHFSDELTVISFISDVMKNGYEFCKRDTDKRLKDLGDGCTIPSPKHFSDVYSFRKKYGQTDDALKELKEEAFKNIKKKIDSHISGTTRNSSDESVASSNLQQKKIEKMQYIALLIESNPKMLNAFEKFLDAFVECSWLMLISEQPIELQFDVLGEIWDTSLAEKFEKYSTDDTVCQRLAVNTITQVAWPELDDKHGIQAKGSVVTVDENIDTDMCKLQNQSKKCLLV